MTVTITSPANPLVKDLAALKERRNRQRTGLMLIEGQRELGHALVSSRVQLNRIIVSEELAGLTADRFATEAAGHGIPLTLMSEPAFAKLSMRRHPDGIAGVAVAPGWSLDGLEVGVTASVVVVEGVEKPGNLGAILRTADAAGMDAVIVAGPGVDLGNPNVIRASQGSIFDIAVAQAEPDAAVAWLQQRQIRLVVATPDAAADIWEADLAPPIAVGVGSEHAGISRSLRDAATLVRIPMTGAADSLNVSVAAALLIYESLRQAR